MVVFLTFDDLILNTAYLVTDRLRYYFNNDYSFLIKLSKANDSTEYAMKIENSNQIFTKLMGGKDEIFTIKKIPLTIGTGVTIETVIIVEDEDWKTLTLPAP